MSAAAATVQWLNSIANGAPWIAYLHLEDLQKPDVSIDVLNQVSRNLTLSDAMDAGQKAFASRSQLQQLKMAIDKAIRRFSYANDAEAAQGELQYQVDLLMQSLLNYEHDQLGIHAENARIAWRTLRSDFPGAGSGGALWARGPVQSFTPADFGGNGGEGAGKRRLHLPRLTGLLFP